MISLRLSESEYEVLRKIHRNYGARNVSDFARLAMQRIMSGSPDLDMDVAMKVHELEDRVRALEASLLLVGKQAS